MYSVILITLIRFGKLSIRDNVTRFAGNVRARPVFFELQKGVNIDTFNPEVLKTNLGANK